MAITAAEMMQRIEHVECADPPPHGTTIPIHRFKHEVLAAFYRLLDRVPEHDRNAVAEILRKQFASIDL